MGIDITPEEKIKKLVKEFKMVTAKLSDCKNERPTTPIQRLRWHKRIQRLKRRRGRLSFEIDELKK